MTCVVTISATYGAGGSLVAPAVAERLEVPFLDRAIPSAVARRIGCTLAEALARDDRAPTGIGRLLASAGRVPGGDLLRGADTTFAGVCDADGRLLHDRDFVAHTEQLIGAVGRVGGVVLGRAAAILLARHPTALHVRLDGPKERRLKQAAAMRDAAHEEALMRGRVGDEPEWRPPTMRELEDNDRARAAYVQRFYRADAAEPSLYHLVLDSTAVPLYTCVDVVERLARERAGEG
ncbi:AAA family ATPase [Marinactinospora thermotolerans]|uniref:Cytidylate kinase n=1 Tax=Marinactinospora thermotolerans DSM 45154 TaxID=1122192 RepID=A0A1T4Q8F0_9ACTN|nr:cytidylate kinase-like family protein [Marinactinospora thermotolerans]SJZ99488.1 Cytidylate kinase [Marinactinospora thermotolerans DSM 45154]